MQIIEATREQLVLSPSRKDESFGDRGAFIFSINLVPLKPTPKKLVIRTRHGRSIISWSMSWRKFLDEVCIGDVVILRKEKLTRSVSKARGKP